MAFSSCLSSATFSALTVTFFFLLLVGIGIPARVALFATAMVGLGTPIFAYSAWLFSEPLSAADLCRGGVTAVRSRPCGGTQFPCGARVHCGVGAWAGNDHPADGRAGDSGVCAGDSSAGRKARAAQCVGPVRGVGGRSGSLYLLHNAVLFGGPFHFGYPAAAEGAKRLNTFDTPLWKGLYGFLLSPGKSVFIFAPPVILALAGLRRLWNIERGVATVAVLLPLTYLFFFARYTQWEGGYCVGPRYLVPSIVLLCLGLGPVLAEGPARRMARTKKIAVLLLVVGSVWCNVSRSPPASWKTRFRADIITMPTGLTASATR